MILLRNGKLESCSSSKNHILYKRGDNIETPRLSLLNFGIISEMTDLLPHPRGIHV